MILKPPDGTEMLDAIAFNRMPDDLPQTAKVRMLYRLAINRWRGEESCQLMIDQIVYD